MRITKGKRDAEPLTWKKRGRKALGERGKKPVPIWEAKQAKGNPEPHTISLSRPSSALTICQAACEHSLSGGIWGAEGLTMATENCFVVLFGEFSFGFCILHFCLQLYNTFPAGTANPLADFCHSVKCRPIYSCYLKMCGPERKCSPNSSQPQGFLFVEACER